MHYLDDPTGLVVFAGRWLWPQLDALAQWGDTLASLVIIAADDQDAPGGSAHRLADFAREFFPDMSIRVTGPIDVDDPLQALAAITAAATEGPWLVDASGGSRMMFTGALLAGQQRQNLRVIHREPPGPWFELEASGKAREIQGTQTWATDRFTVEALLEATWSEGRRVARVAPASIEPEIERAARDVLQGAGWRSSFYAAVDDVVQRRSGKSSGPLFEEFVLALVRGLGVDNDDTALSAVLFDHQTRVQEVDVVVNSNGRLHVIDCKLTDEELGQPIGMQIRVAEATRRHLGDDADQYILLRPNITIDDTFRDLCDAYDLRVVDARTLEEQNLPDVLRDLLVPAAKMPGQAAQRASVHLPVTDGVVDLSTDFIQSRQPMRIYDLGRYLFLKCSPGRGVSPTRLRKAVEAEIVGIADMRGIDQNSGGTSFTVIVHARPGKMGEARAALLRLGKRWA